MGNFTSVSIQSGENKAENLKKPNLENPSKIMKQDVKKIFQCKRNLNALGVGYHTDTIFCSTQSCLLVSFHENVSRVDIGKFNLDQAKDIYYTCEEYLVEEKQKMSYIKLISKKIAARKDYSILDNNCNHSAQELLEKLRITFHRTVSPKLLKIK